MSTTALFVYMTHSAVVSRFETSLPLRTREKGWDVSDPPKNRGVMRPFVAVGCYIPLLGPMTGRSRPHLSLREGSETAARSGAESPASPIPSTAAPLPPRASLCRIGPRRQGSASPLRALDRSGPIWREALFTMERGGTAGRESTPGRVAHVPCNINFPWTGTAF